MNKWIVYIASIFMLLALVNTATAQPQYYNNNSGSSLNNYPLNVFNGKCVQWLYLAGEFNQTTSAPMGSITSLSFRAISTGLSTGIFDNVIIKLGQSDTNSLTTGEFYTGALSLVYSNASASLSVDADGWLTIILDRPFFYNPTRSLIVELSQDQITQGGFQVYQKGHSTPPYRRVWSVGGSPFVAYGGGDGSLCDLGLNIRPGNNQQDYDGDNKADLAVFDDVKGLWYVNSLDKGVLAWEKPWGWDGAVPLLGDYDGDGKADLAVFDDAKGLWYVNSLDKGVLAWEEQWGWAGAVPVPGDYDGDGEMDLAVFDDAKGLWYVNSLDKGILAWEKQWGWAGAVPVPGDYDGDGKMDMAVFDDVGGLWYVYSMDKGVLIAWEEQWGWSGAVPVPGDYDGDGKADLAVYDNVHGHWYIRTVSGTVLVWESKWGWAGALTVPER